MAAEATVILVYQNSMPWLGLALEALEARSPGMETEYLLVENPSTDSSPRAAAEFVARDPGRRKILKIAAPPVPGPGGGMNHGHALSEAFREVRTLWTVFLDADTIVLADGWLAEMAALGALVGPPAFAWLRDLSMPHAHPCLLAFRTELGRPPHWDGDFRLWRKGEHPEMAEAAEPWWDTAIPFTHLVGRRPEAHLANLAMDFAASGAYRLSVPSPVAAQGDAAASGRAKCEKMIALHLRAGSNAAARKGGISEALASARAHATADLTILTRTHGRPQAFARCRRAVELLRAGWPGRLTHHVICDDPADLAYAAGDVVSAATPRPDAECGPNLYFAEALAQHLAQGWVLHLDDDDTVSGELQAAVPYLADPRNLVLWPVWVARLNRQVPRQVPAAVPRRGDISGIGFLVHASQWRPWEGRKAADWRFLSEVWPRLKKVWVRRRLTEAGATLEGGLHEKRDQAENGRTERSADFADIRR